MINRSNIVNLLRPGLESVFWNYNRYPDFWKQIYQVKTSKMESEYTQEMQNLGLGTQKEDGAPTTMGTMNQGYQARYFHKFYSLGFPITRGAIEDNLYLNEFPQQGEQLRVSMATLKNINGAHLFNHAFDALSSGPDGMPLCSTAHPTSVGTLSNTFNNGVQLSEAAVEDLITIIKGWTDFGGIRTNISADKVLIPQQRAFDAARIFKSEFRPGTANNDINALVTDKYMPGGYLINQFITNPNYWFILTDAKTNGFKYFLRTPLDYDFVTDIVADIVTVRVVERYSFGYDTFRCVAGSSGA